MASVTLRPEAEPYAADRGPVGAVLCHGLTGMPGSLRDWGVALADAGLTVRIPRLPGHGTTWKDANRTSWQDWYTELERTFDEVRGRCEQVFVMGLSMGGTVTLRLAEQRGDDIAGVVVVNPSLFTTRKDAKLLPLMRLVVPSFPPVGNDVKKPGVVEPAYDRLPLKAAYQLAQLWKVTTADLAQLTQPLLVFTSRDDHVADALLAALRSAGIAAYVMPMPGSVGGSMETRVPSRPLDRLYVDDQRVDEARGLVEEETASPAESASAEPATAPAVDFEASW